MRRFSTSCALFRRLVVMAGGLALSLGVLLALPATAYAEASATVGEYAQVPDAITHLSEADILRGRDAVSLVLQGYVTRGQLAVYLARSLGLAESTTPFFSDVADSEACFGAVGALYEAGLITGTASATFSPDELVSRQQAAVWIVEALGYKLSHASESTVPFRLSYFESADAWLAGFRDRSLIDATFARGVANGYRLGIVDATADGWLCPTLPLSRGDMVIMLDRAFVETISGRDAYPPAVSSQAGYPSQEPKSEGPLVWYLEHQLTVLKYRPGPIDGVYDSKTKDAVMAFQKVEKLKRDGLVGGAFWQRLPTAQTPAARLHAPGTRVEIDLTRQVLFMITENHVWKIVHVSTGASTTGTLTGHFTVRDKSPGWLTSSYRTGMYYAVWFRIKLAIHGYSEVPPWPASHGCVRVPVWMAKELFYEIPMGTAVDIYR